MASHQHPVSRVLPIAAWVIVSVLGSVFLGARFLRKKRGQHGNSCRTNAEIEHQQQQQQQQEESEGSHNVPSTSSSIDLETGHEFEVFLSFRGSDNRRTFIDHLYHRLKDAGIRAFRDDEELRVGEEIGPELMKSIKQSKIAMPIFSKNYASSKWCLTEVSEMVKCMKETRQLIMPVFLDATPDEVQHQTGSYAESFAQHQSKFGHEVVQGWRNALKEVVKLKGLELNIVANGNEGEFVKFIVARIIRQLKKSYLEVSDNLIGIDDRAEELRKKLEVDIDDVRVVGVWGMGGIGKTTLAKFVYNQIVDSFDCSCFLSNIRETSQNPIGLQNLQSKLASDILRLQPMNFTSVDEGVSVLKERLRHKKALILLDDVDSNEQLKNLAEDVKWFGRGSGIIITTREKAILDQFGVQDLYEVALMDKVEAIELFCRHAFGDGFPKTDFAELTRDIVDRTGGLPLALEVIGSFLSTYRGRKDMWEDTLKKLRNEPNIDVQNNLKISYDSLERNEREIFLDIACFFIGVDQRVVKPMWSDIGFAPVMGIEILLQKSLIKIKEDNKIWMHDQIRDLGRYIVEKENYGEPRHRSRLWRSEDAINVLERRQESLVKGIYLDGHRFREHEGCLNNEMVKNLPELRLLQLQGVRLDGNFQLLLQGLRWLSWQGKGGSSSLDNKSSLENEFPLKKESPPENIILNNLIVLDLSQRLIHDNWIGWSSIKIGVKLKVLNLRNCGIRSTPDFSAFPSLEILILELCLHLTRVDPSIGCLKNLILLDLRNCSSLKVLPKQIGSMESLVEFLIDDTNIRKVAISNSMKKLEILSANNCSYLEIHPSIGSLENLKILHLGNCMHLQPLPELPSSLTSLTIGGRLSKLTLLNIANLVNLEKLSLKGRFELEENCLSSLRKLEVLHLDSVKIGTLPKEMSSFPHLQKIDVYGCEGLTYIPALPSSLSSLRIDRCESLRRLPDLSNMKNLSTLDVTHCCQIEAIEGLGNLLSLKFLHTIGSPLNQLDGIERLEYLEEISVQPSLVERLPNLSNLKKLQRLHITQAKRLVEIQDLSNSKRLTVLVIARCKLLKFLPKLPNSLLTLDIHGCEQISQVDAVAELTSLEFFTMEGCRALKKLPYLSKLQRLFLLNIAWCEDITEIPGLEELSRLGLLYTMGCKALTLPDLSKQKSNGLRILTD